MKYFVSGHAISQTENVWFLSKMFFSETGTLKYGITRSSVLGAFLFGPPALLEDPMVSTLSICLS